MLVYISLFACGIVFVFCHSSPMKSTDMSMPGNSQALARDCKFWTLPLRGAVDRANTQMLMRQRNALLHYQQGWLHPASGNRGRVFFAPFCVRTGRLSLLSSLSSFLHPCFPACKQTGHHQETQSSLMHYSVSGSIRVLFQNLVVDSVSMETQGERLKGRLKYSFSTLWWVGVRWKHWAWQGLFILGRQCCTVAATKG